MEAVVLAFVAFVNVRSALTLTKLSPANFANAITSRAIVTMSCCVPAPNKVHADVVNVIASPAGPEMPAIVELLTIRACHPVAVKFVPATASANVVPVDAR